MTLFCAEMIGPLMGAQGYQRFLFSMPIAGQSIALHAVPAYRDSAYLPSQLIQLHFRPLSSLLNGGEILY